MDEISVFRRALVRIPGVYLFAAVAAANTASAICTAPPEMGRWRNDAADDAPQVLDLRMSECSDQAADKANYSMRVWVKQSSGEWYGRPTVKASYRDWNGKRWLTGRIPIGGFVDNVWVSSEERNGVKALHVLIKHEGPDNKPGPTTEHWFWFEKAM